MDCYMLSTDLNSKESPFKINILFSSAMFDGSFILKYWCPLKAALYNKHKRLWRNYMFEP